MKLFCFTYALYILALSMLPCGDACDNNFIPQTLVSEPVSSHNDHHEDEICSPFCICPCCGSVCNQSNKPIVSSIMNNPSALNQPAYEDALLKEIYFTIWQPPKIS